MVILFVPECMHSCRWMVGGISQAGRLARVLHSQITRPIWARRANKTNPSHSGIARRFHSDNKYELHTANNGKVTQAGLLLYAYNTVCLWCNPTGICGRKFVRVRCKASHHMRRTHVGAQSLLLTADTDSPSQPLPT